MEQKISDKSISCFIQKSFLKGGLRWIFFFLLLILFSTVIIPLKLYAVPAYDEFFELKQPSGFSFEARQHGDEWYNWVETKDGYGVYKNTITDNWEYYLPSADTDCTEAGSKGRLGQIQDSLLRVIVGDADPSTVGIPKGLRPPKTLVIKPQSFALEQNIPHKESLQTELEEELKSTAVSGTMHLLVIAVDYVDATATYTADQIQPLFFGASDSVSDYYSKTSYSSVTITPATESHGLSNDGFIGWLRLSGNHPNTGSNIDARNQQIAKSAILAADPYINYAQYDVNGNGIVEPTELSVMIIVAGYEAATGGPSPSVWAHQWWMGDVGFPNVDGKTIQQYAQFGEKHGNHLATLGVMAHELGHLMFGLPDLYDTDTNNGDSEGIGFFDLMGGGGWGAVSGAYGGSSPTQLSAWSKEYLSWGIVNSISSSQSVSFPKTDGNSSSIFRINTLDSNQYFLIENRQFTGYDKGFEGATGASGHGGLVIYHIDKLKTPPQNWNVNADENDKGVDVEEANEGSLGYSMLDTKSSAANTNMFFFSGNNISFTDTTTPNSKLKNGNSTNISVKDISTYGETMTATVTLSPPQTGSIRVTIIPQKAVNDGAQWKLTTENTWHDSRTIKSEVPFGTYQVEFKTIDGWVTPPNKEVTIFAGNPDIWIDSDPYIRTTVTLTVASSNPNSGVSITVSPNDINGQGSGTTQFTRTYNDNTTITLTAPLTADGNSFQKWQRNGVDWTTSQTANVVMDANHTMKAVYATFPTPQPTPGATGYLTGQVTDAQTGAGINGATVTVDTGETTTTGTVQGVDGVYATQNVSVGQHDITASAQNYASSTQTVTVEEGNPNPQTGKNVFDFELTSTIPFGSISGRVTDDATTLGIPGATVAYGTSTQNIVDTTTTDADGKYSFDNVIPGTYTVQAQATGYQPEPPVQVTVDAGETETVNFAFTPIGPTPTPTVSPTPTPGLTGSIEGEVVNQTDGMPIAGASVVLDSKVNVATTDTNGLYRFNTVPAGQHKMSAGAKGFKQSEIETITVVANQTARQNFFLAPRVTPTPIASPTPEATPTSPCPAELMGVFPVELKLESGESSDVTIIITCEDGVTPVSGETVKAKVKSGSDVVTVSPLDAITDTNGQAIFTIIAKNKVGKAKVVFKDKSAGLKTTVKVKVVK
ncbi:MAG: M6 family metalloprotease domain-containing protein [Candidatus Brocadia sp.]|nr:M6 family metalloprotease domain-containing protein [Candidatus Brocadia sp.]